MKRRRRLGQHYLVDPEVVRKIVAFAKIGSRERVLEIGTGKGALTRELARSGAPLVGYELDPRNYEESVQVIRGTNAEILLGDAFKESPRFDVLVSSLPYSESATFIEWLCSLDFERAVVVLQEDFLEKITAPPGARDYRGISALAQISFDIQLLDHVAKKSFSPQPKVGSVIVSFAPRLKISEAEASKVKRLFSLRRRQIDSALAELGMEGGGSHGKRRVYSLTPGEVHELCRPSLPT